MVTNWVLELACLCFAHAPLSKIDGVKRISVVVLLVALLRYHLPSARIGDGGVCAHPDRVPAVSTPVLAKCIVRALTQEAPRSSNLLAQSLHRPQEKRSAGENGPRMLSRVKTRLPLAVESTAVLLLFPGGGWRESWSGQTFVQSPGSLQLQCWVPSFCACSTPGTK